MIFYNKLIRDRIPEIISNDNKLCEFRILDNTEFSREIYIKLVEEMAELSNACTRDEIINEMVDIHELLDTLRDIQQINLKEVLTKQKSKGLSNGKFNRRLFLISVDEKE